MSIFGHGNRRHGASVDELHKKKTHARMLQRTDVFRKPRRRNNKQPDWEDRCRIILFLSAAFLTVLI